MASTFGFAKSAVLLPRPALGLLSHSHHHHQRASVISPGLLRVRPRKQVTCVLQERGGGGGASGPPEDYERYAATRFIELARSEGITIDELRRRAPEFNEAHLRFLSTVDERLRDYAGRLSSAHERMVDLQEKHAGRLISAHERMVDLQEKHAGQVKEYGDKIFKGQEELREIEKHRAKLEKEYRAALDSAANVIRLLEKDRANSGLRVLVETMLSDFNNLHFAGHCTDPLCITYLTDLEKKGTISKLALSGAGVQMYQLTGSPKWSKVATIEHFAACPQANLILKYADRFNTEKISMKESDLRADIAARARTIWGDLHAGHHILDAQSLPIRLPYSARRQRSDTLFYLTACKRCNIEVEVVEEEVGYAEGVIAEATTYFAQPP